MHSPVAESETEVEPDSDMDSESGPMCASPPAAGADDDLVLFDEDIMEIEEGESCPPPPPPPAPAGTGILASATNYPPPPPTPVFDSEMGDLMDMSVDISMARCQLMADELYNRWYLYMQGFGTMGFMAAYKLFGLDPDQPTCNAETLNQRGTRYRELCIALYERMVLMGAIDQHNEADEVGKRLTMSLHVIGRAVEMMVARCNLADTSTANFNAANSSSMNMFKVRIGVTIAGDETAVAALNSFQRLILTVLAKAFRMNLRKHQGFMFEQVLTEDPLTGATYRTHAWKEHMSISDFVFKCCNKHTDWAMWNDLTAGRGNKDFAVEYINNSPSDFELRGLNSDRHMFSFNNGLYDAREDQMYAYGSTTKPIPETFVASKFFDVPMPMDFDDVGDEPIDFRDIPTPHLDGILQFQGFSEEPWVPLKHRNKEGYPGYSVTDWIYVFMGRMIYEVGEKDTWQALMFLKGKAGTGKSTLGKIMSYMYDEVDVGVLSNNIERKFGLSGLVDKLFYICYEVKKDFGLDQGEMQSMISGEPIGIATKNKDPRSVTWKTHGVFMGNEFPTWTNNSGSVGRRILTVLFNTMVTSNSDPRLYQKLQAEMGNIIVKINRAYRECAYVYGADDVWSVLPPYFEEMRERELEAYTSPLSAYLVYLKYDDQGKTFEFCPDARIPFTEFRIQANNWVAENLGTKKSLGLTGDDLHPLSTHGLRKDSHDLVGLRIPVGGDDDALALV